MATLHPGASWKPSRSKSFRSFWRTLVSVAFIIILLTTVGFSLRRGRDNCRLDFEFFQILRVVRGLRTKTVRERGEKNVVKKFRVTIIIIEIKRYEVKSSLPKLDSFRAPFLKEIVAFIIHDNKRGEIDDVDLPNRFHPQLRELLDLHFLDVGFG